MKTQRVKQAFQHIAPDRTPLFEIFQPYHPIFWDICGRNIATDAAMAWDAMADGAAWEEFVETSARAQYKITRYFDLDMVRLCGVPQKDYPRPIKIGPTTWELNGIKYIQNERTKLVEAADPTEEMADSNKINEDGLRKIIMEWNGRPNAGEHQKDPVLSKIQKMAAADGVDLVFMGEIGAGTGVAAYPPFMLEWMILEPELFLRWLEMQKTSALIKTQWMIEEGCQVIAMGGDVSSDKGPFISPQMYHDLILPVIKEHVNLIHKAGALAVYTSDGNHWAIKDDIFFNSCVDGYKEVDKAAGMTWPRLIEAGINKRICIIGNVDARHTLCRGSVEDVRQEVFECLKYGQSSPGGHILHASHSVHEDVKVENYRAMISAYREFFGLEKLS